MREPIEDVPFRPLGEQSGATLFDCPLCGMAFTHGEQVCSACPLSAGCDIVRCPGCGYSFPRTSRIVEWVRRLVRRARKEPA